MICFLLVSIIIDSIESQTWTGTYIPDSSCNTTSCCCLSGKAVITSLTANSYSVQSGLTGVLCSGATTFRGTLYTNGYTGSIIVGSDNDTVTLTSDSANITVTNSKNPACSGNAVKNGSTMQHANIISYIIGYVLMGTIIKNSIL